MIHGRRAKASRFARLLVNASIPFVALALLLDIGEWIIDKN